MFSNSKSAKNLIFSFHLLRCLVDLDTCWSEYYLTVALHVLTYSAFLNQDWWQTFHRTDHT